MNDSKAERVRRFLEARMREVAAECALNMPDSAAWLKNNAGYFQRLLVDRIAYDKYRMKELKDIFDWKEPPQVR
jgi:hypothetical protein